MECLGELKKLQHLVIRIITLWSNFTPRSSFLVFMFRWIHHTARNEKGETKLVAVKRANNFFFRKKRVARSSTAVKASSDGWERKEGKRQEKTTDLTLLESSIEFLHSTFLHSNYHRPSINSSSFHFGWEKISFSVEEKNCLTECEVLGVSDLFLLLHNINAAAIDESKQKSAKW